MSETTTTVAPATTLNGTYNVWSLNGHNRTYADVHMAYKDAIEYVIPVRYNALSGKGEQRELFVSHARKIKSEMLAGTYTPTQISANLRKNHRENNLKLAEEARTFSLAISSDDPLAQTDGGHRYGALDLIVREIREKLEKTEKEAEKAKLQAQLDEVMKLEVGIRIYFDGDPQKDFINLQAGRTVDAAHMLSLRIQKNVLGDSSFKLAFAVAKLLGRTEGSPFEKLIRFDSKQPNKDTLVKQLPISTVMGKSSSDLGTSLVGLARVGSEKDATFLAHCIVAAYKTLNEKAPQVFEQGKVLTTVRNGGTKGSATMLIGVGTCLAHRLITLGRDLPTQEDLDAVVSAATSTLNQPVGGNFSGPVKRQLMGAFARNFFAGLTTIDRHDGLPLGLLKATSASTFDAVPLPKPEKASKGGKNKTEATTPDVDSPIDSEEVPPMKPADYAAFDEEVSEETLGETVKSTPVYEEAAATTAAPWSEAAVQG